MKHRKYRILSILLLACLALQAVIPGAWAEAAPEGWETLAPAETAAPEECSCEILKSLVYRGSL